MNYLSGFISTALVLFSASAVMASENTAVSTKAIVTCNVDKESAIEGFTGEWKITLDLSKKIAVVKNSAMDDYENGNKMAVKYVVLGDDSQKPNFSTNQKDSNVMLVSLYGSNGDDIEFAINLTFNTFGFDKTSSSELVKPSNSMPAQMTFTVLDGQFQQATSKVINCTAVVTQ